MKNKVPTIRPRRLSSHVKRQIAIASLRGGWAGKSSATNMWQLSKRELIEVALRLGASASGFHNSPSAGRGAVLRVLTQLRYSKII